jgi:hypothetical protein
VSFSSQGLPQAHPFFIELYFRPEFYSGPKQNEKGREKLKKQIELGEDNFIILLGSYVIFCSPVSLFKINL